MVAKRIHQSPLGFIVIVFAEEALVQCFLELAKIVGQPRLNHSIALATPVPRHVTTQSTNHGTVLYSIPEGKEDHRRAGDPWNTTGRYPRRQPHNKDLFNARG